ncbi:MAG: hypothetical protein J6X84_05240 [Treponema sp.]|nr:hypothetical protein [Treponema sp.]
MNESKKSDLSDIHYVKLVTIGSVNPNNPISDQSRQAQVDLLNRCLSDFPKGILLGKDITIGRYMLGEHELTMERITYHVGFSRKPAWLEE